MDKYKIIYKNGNEQFKNLITKEQFKDIQTNNTVIDAIESSNGHKTKEGALEIFKIKKYLEKTYGEYFVIGSPLHKAVNDGIMILPSQQGGNIPIKVVKLKE